MVWGKVSEYRVPLPLPLRGTLKLFYCSGSSHLPGLRKRMQTHSKVSVTLHVLSGDHYLFSAAVRYVTETVIRSVQHLQLNKLPNRDEGARKNGRLRGAVSVRGPLPSPPPDKTLAVRSARQFFLSYSHLRAGSR